MMDPIYDQRDLDCLRSQAEVYIHGHSAGGTNPSLVEAMSLGLPVFAFDVPFNRYTSQNAAGYFKDAEELAMLLGRSCPDALASMGTALAEHARIRYTWRVITGRYREILFGKDETK
jgi:glycosyltransferase involved in cell wall biosynthesis